MPLVRLKYQAAMNNNTCNWINPWNDSGDRGAAQADHNREYHPGHEHVFEDSTYEWEQKGVMHIAPGDRTNRTPRPSTVQRCAECAIRSEQDQSGKC